MYVLLNNVVFENYHPRNAIAFTRKFSACEEVKS